MLSHIKPKTIFNLKIQPIMYGGVKHGVLVFCGLV